MGSLGFLEKSIEEFNKALEINPKYANAFYNLAVVYEMLGNYYGAKETYHKVLSINPDHPETITNLKFLLNQEN